MDTSTCFDHCRLRGRGRHPAPKRCPTRLSLFLQRAPSCSTQDPSSRQRIGQFCVEHISSPGRREVSALTLVVAGSHLLKYSFNLADSSSSSSPSGTISVRPVLPDASHIRLARRHAGASWWGRSQAIGLDRRLVTRLFLTDLHLDDGPSAPTHLIVVDDKRAWRIPWDFTRRCCSNSSYSCLHASNPKPLATCWTTCSAFPLQVRTSTQYACAENRFSALVITVLSVMIGSSTLVSTCNSIQAVVRLDFPK